MVNVQVNQPAPELRRVFFDVRALDGITPATGEDGGQPQMMTNLSPTWGNGGIGVLHFVGNGRYYAELDLASVGVVGTVIETRYKGGSTAETPGDSVQVVPPLIGVVT